MLWDKLSQLVFCNTHWPFGHFGTFSLLFIMISTSAIVETNKSYLSLIH